MAIQKLITKLCHEQYWDWLQKCESEGIRMFGELVQHDREGWVSKYQDNVRSWEEETTEWGAFTVTDASGC